MTFDEDIDFGCAFHKPNGNAVKVTLNYFRGNHYIHIRDYALDGDTGRYYPTKSGFSFFADEVTSLIPLLEEAAECQAMLYKYSTQLEFDFGDENEY
jgi:hypothetical protein